MVRWLWRPVGSENGRSFEGSERFLCPAKCLVRNKFGATVKVYFAKEGRDDKKPRQLNIQAGLAGVGVFGSTHWCHR